jgi:hypothetical protein
MTKRNFHIVKLQHELYRWKDQIEKIKSPLSGAKAILYEHLYTQCNETSQKRCNTNDSDLHDWALHIADEMGIGDIQASAVLILQFKWAHGIGSRKSMEFV